jgi:alanine racemase
MREQEVTIKLEKDQAWLYGADLTHAATFLQNHGAPESVVNSLDELRELLRKALQKTEVSQ